MELLRDRGAEFEEAGVRAFGISRDSPWTHVAWMQALDLAVGLLSLLISFGKHFPLYGFLYDHLPLFNKFRVPVMVIVLFQLASSMGLAWGISSILDRGGKGEKTDHVIDRLLMSAGGLVVIVLALSSASGIKRGPQLSSEAKDSVRRLR